MADTASRLRLLRTAGIGPVTYRQLIARFGDADAAIAALPTLAARGGGRAPQIADRRAVEREIAATARAGGRYLFLDDPDYPPLLADTETAPPALILRGAAAHLARPCVAIVGARNASAAACRFARQLGQELADAGTTIVSGLARGIDTAAHVGAIGGSTIGVIASGIDIAFPPENAALQEDIATRGLLVAEQPPGTEPRARNFPSRNRIIAGLAIGTVVVEAVPRSGSLITARLAAEAGREVMAVPGSPLDPRAQGCNLLIKHAAVYTCEKSQFPATFAYRMISIFDCCAAMWIKRFNTSVVIQVFSRSCCIQPRRRGAVSQTEMGIAYSYSTSMTIRSPSTLTCFFSFSSCSLT